MNKLALSGQMFDDYSVYEHIAAASDYGYDAIELRSTHVNPNTPVEVQEEILKEIKRRNLEVSCISCFVGDFAVVSDEECQKALETAKAYIQIADRFDAPIVRMWPGWVSSYDANEQHFIRAAEWMKKACQEARKHNKKIAMEMHHGTIIDNADSAIHLLELINEDNCGLIFDPVNLYQVPIADIPEQARKLKKYIFDVHVKDIIKLNNGNQKGSFAYEFYAEHIGQFTKVIAPSVHRDDYYAHRRIGMGGVDWPNIMEALKEINYEGTYAVESVCEEDVYMPRGRALAKACKEDLMAILNKETSVKNWLKYAPTSKGLHEVIKPERDECLVSRIFRLNICKGNTYTLESKKLEMNPLLIKGKVKISGDLNDELNKLDSFYIPGNSSVNIEALEDASFYIASATCEGYGKAFVRKYNPNEELGLIHQIHGEGAGQREVFFTLNEEVPASRLICGFTRGGDGAWTSWPPHQHEKDLEEVYCYFDMEEPKGGFHFSYDYGSSFEEVTANPISDGYMVLAPKGYHPTVAYPDSHNTYFWVLCAFSHDQRKYTLSVLDPKFTK